MRTPIRSALRAARGAPAPATSIARASIAVARLWYASGCANRSDSAVTRCPPARPRSVRTRLGTSRPRTSSPRRRASPATLRIAPGTCERRPLRASSKYASASTRYLFEDRRVGVEADVVDRLDRAQVVLPDRALGRERRRPGGARAQQVVARRDQHALEHGEAVGRLASRICLRAGARLDPIRAVAADAGEQQPIAHARLCVAARAEVAGPDRVREGPVGPLQPGPAFREAVGELGGAGGGTRRSGCAQQQAARHEGERGARDAAGSGSDRSGLWLRCYGAVSVARRVATTTMAPSPDSPAIGSAAFRAPGGAAAGEGERASASTRGGERSGGTA